jgi:hypothetical protein
MRVALALLGALLWTLPAVAHASDPPARHQLPPGCARTLHSQARHNEDTLHCLAGTVLIVGDTTVKIQIPHGPQLKITLTPKTVLETDSAIASLEGLMVGDFACASGTVHDHVFSAGTILFDVVPFTCGSPWHSHHDQPHIHGVGLAPLQ